MTVEDTVGRNEQTSVYRQEVERFTHVLMKAWENAEGNPVSASYVATFVDMAKAIVDEIEQREVATIITEYQENTGKIFSVADILEAIADKIIESEDFKESTKRAITWEENREKTLERYLSVQSDNAYRNTKMTAAQYSQESLVEIQRNFANFLKGVGIENVVVEIGRDTYSSQTHTFEYPFLEVTCAQADKTKLPSTFSRLEVRTA